MGHFPGFDDEPAGKGSMFPGFEDVPTPKEPEPSPPPQAPVVAAAPEPVRSLPMSPEKQASVQAQIKAGMLPLPGGARTALDATADAFDDAGNKFGTKALFGIPGRVSSAVLGPPRQIDPLPSPNQNSRAPEDYLPNRTALDVGTGLGAAGADIATMGGVAGKAGETLGALPGQIARRLGASEAQAAVRPSLQTAADAAGGGALFGGSDAAVRGQPVAEGAAQGALGNVIMSQLPAMAGASENALSRQVAKNDLRPIKQMSKKGTLDKELSQFGGGDPEKGAREMVSFVQRENLGPILRQKGASSVNQYEAAKQQVWDQDLKPIYDRAYAAEPNASVPFDEIASRLRANIRKTGGNEHRLVEKAIDEIRARADLVSKSGDIPLATVLTNARDFQSQGHAGVVNYDAPPESKVVMRQVGQVLRGIANDRVASIYSRHPEAAQELFTNEQAKPMGATFRDQASTPGMVRAGEYPDAWARRYKNYQEYAADIPRKLADGNKRFSDYAKLEPLVRQASTLQAGEKKFGLMNLLGHGMTGTAGGLVGYGVGGIPGAIAGTAAVEAGRAAYPYAVRGASAAAGAMGGPAVSPGVTGAEWARMSLDEKRAYAENAMAQIRSQQR